jgi:predicted RNA-binding protein Jag
MMAIGMPMFIYVLWSAPIRPCLYWLVGNIVSFTQQFLINRWTATDEDESPPSTGKSNASGKKPSSPLAAAHSHDMNDVPQQAGEFLESVFNSTGLELGVTVRARLTGPVLDIDGEDAELLQAQTGELLEALQHLVNRVYGRGLEGNGVWCATFEVSRYAS